MEHPITIIDIGPAYRGLANLPSVQLLSFSENAQPIVLNPFAAIATDTEELMAVLKFGARKHLDADMHERAKNIALGVSTPCTRSFIDAWRSDPALVDFANAVEDAFIPK